MGTAVATTGRLRSLDAMRGLTVAGMILVNNPGSWTDGYAWLAHSSWNGWTLADLVFPFFLLIVGVSLDFSLARQTALPAGRGATGLALARRAALLLALGLLLNGFPDYTQLASLRVFGVLQRIALCSLAAGVIVLTTGVAAQLATTLGLLIAYWLLLTVVPVPGHGAGVLTQDGNWAAFVDVQWFAGHLYREGFDPEGLVSTLPAIATTLLGVLAGRFLRSGVAGSRKTLGLVVAGALLALAGQLGDAWLPINKQLWTSTFVLLTAGLGMVTLGVCYELVDRRGWQRVATPFVMLGGNALAIYLLSSLVARVMELCQVSAGDSVESLRLYLFEHCFAPWAGPETGSLCFALTYLLVWMLPTAELHRRRLYLRV
ncbi:MAG: heparan-alpha-glucosaminide N-acetyltransferase domain-containing protein [Candidatus Binatia bacterium]